MQGKTIAGVLMIALALTAGCRTMTGQSLGTNIDNKTTTAAVKTQLSVERLQNLGWVDVDTSAGTVYLSGTASTEQQKRRAEEIARDVDGVKEVVNNIQVRPTTSTAPRDGASTSGPSAGTSASPATSDGTGRYMASGEVTSLDRNSGHLTIRSDGGEIMLNVPDGALRDIQVGDRVEFGIRQLP